MLSRSALALASVSSAALLAVGLGSPVGAADTSLTLTLTGGSLALSAPATASVSGNIGAPSIDLPVAGITVDDDRGSLAGWTVTASATDLVTNADGQGTAGSESGETIDSSTQMLWTTAAISPQEGQLAITVPAAGFLDPTVPATVAVGAPLTSAGLFRINGTITVTVPSNARAGSYTSTLTTTLS